MSRIANRVPPLQQRPQCAHYVISSMRHRHQALEHVYSRSVDPGEVRPELNHASNAAAVVGRRELTKGRSLERRVFLPSYDPYADDEKGTNLERVLAPALVVGSGINLECVESPL